MESYALGWGRRAHFSGRIVYDVLIQEHKASKPVSLKCAHLEAVWKVKAPCRKMIMHLTLPETVLAYGCCPACPQLNDIGQPIYKLSATLIWFIDMWIHTHVYTHAHAHTERGGTMCILFLHFLITKFLPGLRAHTVIPISRKLRQKDCHEPWVQGEPVLYSICHLKGLHREILSKETKKAIFHTRVFRLSFRLICLIAQTGELVENLS